ncbi:MAG: adaptor protein MecA [Acetatifactor sp.]|nr:adaptor protein MecA [Acetatifactor sp.]
MKIERVDDKTVKCFLSNEELDEYDIDYKDFVLRSEKAKEVVQEIIVQAEEAVGYKPPRYSFDLQIMMLPDQGLVLTFSEREPENEPLIECLKEMKRVLQKAREKVGLSASQPTTDQAEAKPETQTQDVQQEPSPAPKPAFAIFAFSALRDVMNFAEVLPGNLRVDSALYEMEDAYYLCLGRGHASYERYSRACIQAMEFGSLYGAEEKLLLRLEEHGKCLIQAKAIKKLRG